MRKRRGKKENFFRNIGRTWQLLKNQKIKLILTLFLSLLLSVISMITPLLSAQLLLNLTNGMLEKLLGIAFFVFLVELVRNTVRYLYKVIFYRYLMDTVSALQFEIARETLKLKTEELDQKSSGVFIDRLNNDCRDIVNIFTSFGESVLDVMTNVGVLVAIFFVNQIFFFYFIITMIVLFLVEKKRIKIFFDMDKKRRKLVEKNTGLIGELVRGIRDIRVLNCEENFLAMTESRLEEANNERYQMEKVRSFYSFWVNTVSDLFHFLFFILGCYLINIGNLSIENFVVLYMYRDRASGLLRYFVSVIEWMRDFNLSAERVFEVISGEKFQKETFGSRKLKKVKGDFEFRDVSFSYRPGFLILKNVNFHISPYETVSFVGKSGSGKSTIFSLIHQLYQVDSGQILIDGVPLQELDKNSIRGNISVITQSPYIFHLSIRDNLKIVKNNVTEEEMVAVCKMACLHDFIMTLPEGYDTIIGEGGLNLSGGERQRLAIARALLKKNSVILFDEATSALDNETQEEIHKAISNMKGKYTILMIAHRLSTVIDSDRLFLVDHGKIVASGSHSELLKNNAIYQKLYEKELSK